MSPLLRVKVQTWEEDEWDPQTSVTAASELIETLLLDTDDEYIVHAADACTRVDTVVVLSVNTRERILRVVVGTIAMIELRFRLSRDSLATDVLVIINQISLAFFDLPRHVDSAQDRYWLLVGNHLLEQGYADGNDMAADNTRLDIHTFLTEQDG